MFKIGDKVISSEFPSWGEMTITKFFTYKPDPKACQCTAKGGKVGAFDFATLSLVNPDPTDEELAKNFREGLKTHIEAHRLLSDRGYKVVYSMLNGSAKITKTTTKEL